MWILFVKLVRAKNKWKEIKVAYSNQKSIIDRKLNDSIKYKLLKFFLFYRWPLDFPFLWKIFVCVVAVATDRIFFSDRSVLFGSGKFKKSLIKIFL